MKNNSNVLKKLDEIIDEMLKNKDPIFLSFYYTKLMDKFDDENYVRTQLVMALMSEIAENKTSELNEKKLEYFLKQLPVKHTRDFKK